LGSRLNRFIIREGRRLKPCFFVIHVVELLDFDNNEAVVLPDFYVWRRNFGATVPPQP